MIVFSKSVADEIIEYNRLRSLNDAALTIQRFMHGDKTYRNRPAQERKGKKHC